MNFAPAGPVSGPLGQILRESVRKIFTIKVECTEINREQTTFVRHVSKVTWSTTLIANIGCPMSVYSTAH